MEQSAPAIGRMRPALVPGLMAGLLLVTGGPARAAQSGAPPAPEEILNRYLERAEQAAEHPPLLSYRFRQHLNREKLDGKGEVNERLEEIRLMVPFLGVHFNRLVERDGKPLEGDSLEKERERERKFHEKRREQWEEEQRKQNEKDEPGEDDILVSEELLTRYRWTLDGTESLEGRPAYKLRFEPKSDRLPVRRRIDRALNKAAGTVWIDAKDYELARVEVRLIEKVRIWGGLVGSISEFQFEMRLGRQTSGEWLPVEQNLYLQARAFFKKVHQREHRTWSSFERVEPSKAAATPPERR